MNFSKKAKGTVSSSLVISAVSAPYALQAKALNFEEIKGSFLNFFARTFYYWWYRKSFINRVNRLLENEVKVKESIVNLRKSELKRAKAFHIGLLKRVLYKLKKLVGVKLDLSLDLDDLSNEKVKLESFLKVLEEKAEEIKKQLQDAKPVFDLFYADELLWHFDRVLSYQKNAEYFLCPRALHEKELKDLLKSDVFRAYEKERDRKTFSEEECKDRESNLKSIIKSLKKKIEVLLVSSGKFFKMRKDTPDEAILERACEWVKNNEAKLKLLEDGYLERNIKDVNFLYGEAVEYEQKAKSLSYDKLLDSSEKKVYDSYLPNLKTNLESNRFYFSGKEGITSIEKNYLEPLEEILLKQAV